MLTTIDKQTVPLTNSWTAYCATGFVLQNTFISIINRISIWIYANNKPILMHPRFGNFVPTSTIGKTFFKRTFSEFFLALSLGQIKK